MGTCTTVLSEGRFESVIELDQEVELSLASSAGARRPPRVKTRSRRSTVRPAPLRWTSPASKVDRAAGRPAAQIGARSRIRIRDTDDRYPLVIELVRATVLVCLAVLAITVVFPALLELAAATSFLGH
jgi:hypothetical protein